MPRDVGVVLVAAGSGTRAGGGVPKQFRPLGGRPVLLWSLQTFLEHPAVAHVAVALPAAVQAAPPDWLIPFTASRLTLVAGGAERHESVERGTAALPPECITVLIHDAARPLIAAATIDAVIAGARDGPGAVPGLPLADTIKELITPDGTSLIIRRTIPRERLWRAQTPQGFPRTLLQRAQAEWKRYDLRATDDSAMVEQLGELVRMVPGHPDNFKLTTEADFALAELLLATRQAGGTTEG